MDTEQEERPKGVHCSESGAEDTVNTHESEVSEENKADEECDEQERQRYLHALNVTEAIARYGKSQGDQVARHPRLLNRGEPTGRKDDRETRQKPLVEATIPTRRKQTNTAKARLRKPRPGEQKQEKWNVSQSSCFPKSEGRHHRWNGKNGLKKEERHNRDDSAYDQARREPVPSHNLQENSQARFFQLDTTTARRNQPVKRWSVLRQAPRGRGKRRPAQAR